jgi:membrane protein implicated in regulation of membrane protease activity
MDIYWYWFIAGICLIILETVAPVAYFLWFGISAILTGAIQYLKPFDLITQTFIFSMFVLITTIAGRRLMRVANFGGKINTSINKKAFQLIGQEITLFVPIENGCAQVKIGETLWNIKGPDLPKGKMVKIIEMNNNQLIVEEVRK